MVRGFAEDSGNTSTLINSVKPYGTTTYRRDVSHKRKVRAYVLYEVEAGLSAVLNDFGVLDFPASAWELIPFSFVVDWFIPIGDWIQAATPKLGVHVITSGASMMEHVSVTRTATAWIKTAPTNSWDMSGIVGHTDSGETRVYDRVELLEIPLFPPPDVNLNVKRAIDGIALLAQTLGRK
jgi:hypothetical protein